MIACLVVPGIATAMIESDSQIAAGHVPSAVNISVDGLRSRLSEVPKDRNIYAFCQIGLRGYIAKRILLQNGLQTCNLTGGYLVYTMLQRP